MAGESSLYRYIWRHSRSEQLTVLAVALAAQPIYFLSLTLPKLIVNGAISDNDYWAAHATRNFLHLIVDIPQSLQAWLGKQWVILSGFDLARESYLLALCISFLVLVGFTGFLKFLMNTMKGRMGERLLRRLRYELVDRVLRFPSSQLRRAKQAEIASMVKDEVEPLGGFIGDAVVWPVFLAGQALTALTFILVQNVWLGLVAGGVVAAQAMIIPRLRRPILKLGKQRQLTARQLAGRVGEIVDGGADIRVHGTSNWERAEIVRRLAKIYDIRFDIYQRKYFVKSLNNFIAQMTPFVFYLIGGYLAIKGKMDVGQLLAVIVAYKDLPGPIKELIDWDLARQDVQIKYDQVMDQFHPDDMVPPELQAPLDEVPELSGDVELKNVTAVDDAGFTLLDDVELKIALDQSTAITGGAGCGKEALGLLFARAVTVKSGSVKLGSVDLSQASDAFFGRRIAYAGPDGYFFPLTLRENLLYGLKYKPGALPKNCDHAAIDRYVAEARRAGNPDFLTDVDWLDYEALGARTPAEITDRIAEILDVVGLEYDVYQFGLQSRLDPKANPAAAERVVEARHALRARLQAENLSSLVESFDPGVYNRNASLAENLLFGASLDPELQASALPHLPHFRRVVAEEGLEGELVAMGLSIAETMIELFRDFPPDHPFFEEFSFIPAAELPAYQAIVKRAKTGGATYADRSQLSILPLRYVEARHRLGLITPQIRERLLAARRTFADTLPDDLRPRIEFYSPDHYNAAANLQDNILFGRISYGIAEAGTRVNAVMRDVLDRLDVRDVIIDAGLAYGAGAAGKRLTPAQRQKLGLARALIKNADFLVLNSVVSGLDDQQKSDIVDRVLAYRRGRGTVWVLTKDDLAPRFDRVVTFDHGRVVGDRTREAGARVAAQ
ncbi:MAG: ATP-binding cassette domain-containing protein [Alphaproteobacteria bacterium]|nr:ATP-binding cassette domain-containing protein [Alphaproteobacteria bacterium]